MRKLILINLAIVLTGFSFIAHANDKKDDCGCNNCVECQSIDKEARASLQNCLNDNSKTTKECMKNTKKMIKSQKKQLKQNMKNKTAEQTEKMTNKIIK